VRAQSRKPHRSPDGETGIFDGFFDPLPQPVKTAAEKHNRLSIAASVNRHGGVRALHQAQAPGLVKMPTRNMQTGVAAVFQPAEGVKSVPVSGNRFSNLGSSRFDPAAVNGNNRNPRQSVSFTDSKVDAFGFVRSKFLESAVFTHALSRHSFLWLPSNT
jgi:hypothetical protein